MLRTWPVRISPEIASPVGRTTLVPNGRTREVIGQTMANSVARQTSPGDTTSAGRRPLCSRPSGGRKRSRSGRRHPEHKSRHSLNDLAAFVRPPIERLSHGLRGHTLKQVGKPIAAARRRDHAPVCLRLDPTRAPSCKPVSAAMSFGMRAPRLFSQRASTASIPHLQPAQDT
jgi:hypothetical protein